MNNLEVIQKQYKFEIPNQNSIEEMDLIDLRRKVMRWCNKSQGAIGPCRVCKNKCSAGARAIFLYDGADAPKASEPSVGRSSTESNKEAAMEAEKEIVENKEEIVSEKRAKDDGKPVSKWYEDAINSGDPVKWCMDNLGLTIQKAKKRIYMYEYNRFGAKRTKEPETSIAKRVVAIPRLTDDVNGEKNESGLSMIELMQSEIQTLTKKQKEYEHQIEDLTDKHKKITDRIEAISMCIELYKDKI